jgi:putative tricarboxylic transport membrane protein
MKQRLYGVVVFLIGAAILWQGRHLGMGSLRGPGSGFFPNVVAIGLMVLSLVLIIRGSKEEEGISFSARAALRILFVFLALIAYSFTLDYLGFLIVSFLLVTYLFRAFGSKKWYMAFAWAFVFVAVAYLLFDTLLEGNLPKGILGV